MSNLFLELVVLGARSDSCTFAYDANSPLIMFLLALLSIYYSVFKQCLSGSAVALKENEFLAN